MKNSERNQTIVLGDKRNLGFAQYGPDSKVFVFHFHGSAGSRFERPADKAILHELGINFISIDRPGHGLSDPQPKRKLLDWADDVGQLADELGADKFFVMGLSAGGPHALGCAYRLSERILACSVVSGLAPPDRPHPYKGLTLSHSMILFISRNSPRLTHMMRRGMHSLARGDTDTLRQRLMNGFPPADRKVLGAPGNAEMMVEEIREGYRQGWSGPAWDDIVINRPWGFRLSDVRVRVDIWHGELDGNIPIDHAKYQDANIPNSRLKVWPGLAHLGLLTKWREVLSSLVESSSKA